MSDGHRERALLFFHNSSFNLDPLRMPVRSIAWLGRVAPLPHSCEPSVETLGRNSWVSAVRYGARASVDMDAAAKLAGHSEMDRSIPIVTA